MTRRPAHADRPQPAGFVVALLGALALLGGCSVLSVPTPRPPTPVAPNAPCRSPRRLPRSRGSASSSTAGWRCSRATTRPGPSRSRPTGRQILSLAPNVRLERGRTYIAIPKGWSDRPTTRNGFESRSSDPVTGNAATDTGDSYRLSSLIGRALGRAGLIINRGY